MIRLNSVTEMAAIIHRYQMDYNQEYYANATLRLDKNNAEMLKFTIAINTYSDIPSIINLGRGVQFTSFNSSFGFFFQSLFNITLSKDAFSIDSKTQ
jgi:hydrogenase-4 membrane subunit HyfE